MPIVHYHRPDGEVVDREVAAGTSVMRAAVNTGVEGIVGECGGQLMCATCHVYVRGGCRGELPGISDDEDEMLEATSEPRDPARSRLSCQLVMGDTLEELDVDIPESQV